MQEETIQAATDAATLEEVVNGLSAGFHIPRMIVVIAAAIVLLIAAKVLSCIIRKALKGLAERSHKFTPMMAGLSSKIVSAVIWLVAAVAALGLFGIDLTPVLAGLGITGVVLGFALQESISSLFSGVISAEDAWPCDRGWRVRSLICSHICAAMGASRCLLGCLLALQFGHTQQAQGERA